MLESKKVRIAINLFVEKRWIGRVYYLHVTIRLQVIDSLTLIKHVSVNQYEFFWIGNDRDVGEEKGKKLEK